MSDNSIVSPTKLLVAGLIHGRIHLEVNIIFRNYVVSANKKDLIILSKSVADL